MFSSTRGRPAICVRGLSKKYPIYPKRSDRLKEAFHPLRRKYHRDSWALRDVSFEVASGETFGIIGENGSGKSTLLAMICGVLQPTEGQCSVSGRISALLELGSGFNPEFSGRDNVFLQGAILGYSRKEIAERFEAIAEFADIGDSLDQPVKTYSTGMMIRLAFSVAINVEPSVLIIDEVLAVGDVFFQAKCYARIEELRARNTTILLVSHDMNSVRTLCSRALCLDAGRMVSCGKAVEVVEAYFKNNALKVGCVELLSEWGVERSEVGGSSFGSEDSRAMQCEGVEEPLSSNLHPAVAPTVAVTAESSDGASETIDGAPDDKLICCAEEASAVAGESVEEASGAIVESASNGLQYGNGKAMLVEYTLNGAANCSGVQVASNSVLAVETVYAIREDIQNPIFGLMLKTPIGLEIYGNNTTYAKRALPRLARGEIVRARFTQRLHLHNGPYLLTLTIAEWVEHQVVYIDRRVDFVLVSIYGGPVPHMGLCNFEGTLEVEVGGPPVTPGVDRGEW